jgi:hypothetical protein
VEEVFIECLEKRIAPATIFVTNLLDDLSAGSLRAAVSDANATPVLDTIIFKPSAFSKTAFNGNCAVFGGGIKASTGGKQVNISKSLFKGNLSGGKGGGIAVYSGIVNIQTSIVTSNIAKLGGGIYAFAANLVAIANTTEVFGNVAPVGPDKNL